MMRKLGAERSHMTDLFFTLALFCVFAASALLVVLIGAQVYRHTADSMGVNYNVRTSLSYVTTKIRQNDVQDGVRLEPLGGGMALVLEQQLEEQAYQTWIYHYDGMLREILVEAGTGFEPGSGQGILEVGGFTVERAGEGLFRLSLEGEDGALAQTLVAVRSSGSVTGEPV